MKTKIAKATVQSNDEMKVKVDRALRQLQKLPKAVASFFHVPTRAYAKA